DLDIPNVVAAILKPITRGASLIWGIRASDMRLEERNRTWRMIFAVERLLAGTADRIICNSWAGRGHLEDSRFPSAAMTVIGNGIDTDRFCPDAAARARGRAEFSYSDEHMVIGLIARLDPMKDHQTFLRAAAELARDLPLARFICVGDGPAPYAGELRRLADSLGLTDRLIWTGARSDIPELLNAFDIATLSSAFGEGFPNAVGEGMATALPYVTTDVGDAARVVGDAGTVVPIASPSDLAGAWRDMAALSPQERAEIGRAARARVVANFPRQIMIDETSAQLHDVCRPDAGAVSRRETV
ncbi:MAG: glycosyltransferase, partial [Rhodospirillaceae bacterium]|nr:glycosyltransferase [Rhodospirillaceae bacterium]